MLGYVSVICQVPTPAGSDIERPRVSSFHTPVSPITYICVKSTSGVERMLKTALRARTRFVRRIWKSVRGSRSSTRSGGAGFIRRTGPTRRRRLGRTLSVETPRWRSPRPDSTPQAMGSHRGQLHGDRQMLKPYAGPAPLSQGTGKAIQQKDRSAAKAQRAIPRSLQGSARFRARGRHQSRSRL